MLDVSKWVGVRKAEDYRLSPVAVEFAVRHPASAWAITVGLVLILGYLLVTLFS